MNCYQKVILIPPQARGYHLITRFVLKEFPEISGISAGMFHLFIQHTSASLTINENADPTVRSDFESHLNLLVPENEPHYLHNSEGPDDMPAHIKASLMGASVMVPISKGRLALGTWQGIYLCEHRDDASGRSVVGTILGKLAGPD